MLGQATVRTAWVLHYQLNRSMYIRHCENRNKPSMKCDGKCYLKKKMMGTAGNDSRKTPQMPESFRDGKDLQLFAEQLPSWPDFKVEPIASVQRMPYQGAALDGESRVLEKPPQA
ncbi:MAG TPA: hypothetical protein PKH43_07565 [Saprospiraceae bacterium]|nr:hypothetical protein [Saprospiraceae bacterium]